MDHAVLFEIDISMKNIAVENSILATILRSATNITVPVVAAQKDAVGRTQIIYT